MFLFLYKILELKKHIINQKRNLLISNISFDCIHRKFNIFAISWEDEFGIVRYYPDIIEDILMMLIIITVFHIKYMEMHILHRFRLCVRISVQLLGRNH